MAHGNGGVHEVDVTLAFMYKRLRAVAASVLMRRHSSGPMATSGIEWTSKRGTLWESLMELLLQVYICCWCNFSNCWFAVWPWSWELNLSWCHQVLLSPRSMNLKTFWMMPVLWAHMCTCVHIHPTIGMNWRQSYWQNTRQQTTTTKPLVKSITFFQLWVVTLSRNKRGTLFEVKWNVGGKPQYLILLWMFAITLFDSTEILNYHPGAFP